MIVVLFGHPVPGVAENEGSIADVLGLSTAIEVATQSRNRCGERLRPKAAFGVVDDPVRQRCLLELGSDFRHPDRVEFRMDYVSSAGRRDCRSERFSPQEDRSMHVEIAFEPRRERRREHRLVEDMRFWSRRRRTAICQEPPTFTRCRPSRIIARFLRRTPGGPERGGGRFCVRRLERAGRSGARASRPDRSFAAPFSAKRRASRPLRRR